MRYKTMVLGLLEQRPDVHHQLRKKRILLRTVERYAEALKTSHELWKDYLSWTRPGSDPSQVANEALEFALQKLKDCLHLGVSESPSEPLSLEEAMSLVGGRRSSR